MELRSTPKALDGKTKKQYIEAILEVLEQAELDMPNMKVRYIVSVNRTDTDVDGIRETLGVIKELASPYIVGLELSGDPRSGSFETVKEVIEEARRDHGLKVTLHCAEVPEQAEESQAMIDFRPDRLGHCCYLSED